MKTNLKLAASVAALLLTAPAAALAQTAFTTNDLNMRAGPGVDYPRVATIPDDSRVNVNGCLNGYNWCDVTWAGNRGWVSGAFLNYAENDRYVAVEEWGARSGIPVISFQARDYWSRYYRDRPWWNERETWFRDDRGGRDRDERWRDRDDRRDQWRGRDDDRRGDRDRGGWTRDDDRRGWQGGRQNDRDDDRGPRGMNRGDNDRWDGDRGGVGRGGMDRGDMDRGDMGRGGGMGRGDMGRGGRSGFDRDR